MELFGPIYPPKLLQLSEIVQAILDTYQKQIIPFSVCQEMGNRIILALLSHQNDYSHKIKVIRNGLEYTGNISETDNPIYCLSENRKWNYFSIYLTILKQLCVRLLPIIPLTPPLPLPSPPPISKSSSANKGTSNIQITPGQWPRCDENCDLQSS